MFIRLAKNRIALWTLFVTFLATVLLSCFVLPTAAKADTGERDTRNKVYFITDRANSPFYEPICDVAAHYAETHSSFDSNVGYYDWSDDFYGTLKKVNSGEMSFDVEDAYVVVEVYYEFPEKIIGVDDESDFEVFKLEQFLRTLKQVNNCKILLLSGVDETVINQSGEAYSEFYSYADMHVKTSLFVPFIHNAVSKIYSETHTESSDTYVPYSLFLDDSLSNIGIAETRFGRKFIETYSNEFYAAKGNIDEMISTLEIDIYLMDDGQNDVLKGFKTLVYDGDVPEFPDGENLKDKVYALATNMIDDECTLTNWLTALSDYSAACGVDISGGVYAGFRPIEQSVADIAKDKTDRFDLNILNSKLGYVQRWFPQMFYDFIRGRRLGKYNNWFGACEITYMPCKKLNYDFDDETDDGFLTDDGCFEDYFDDDPDDIFVDEIELIESYGAPNCYGWYDPDYIPPSDKENPYEIRALSWAMSYLTQGEANLYHGIFR